MDSETTLERVDVDGAIRETAHDAAEALEGGDTRLNFLKKAGLAGGAAMGGGALQGDVGILNYALTLEYLEAAFYADVIKSGLFKGSDLATIRKFGQTEDEHVEALKRFVVEWVSAQTQGLPRGALMGRA